MSEFLFLFRGGEPQSTPAAMQQEMQKWVAWMKDLSAKGHLKNAGNPLERDGKVVSGKKKTVTDGPFAEKDLVGGYTVIEARDLGAAVALSMGCPIFDGGGHVEVRPIRKFDMG